VVASTVAGIPEVIDNGVTGVLVAPGDAHHLAAALVGLAEDAGLRRRLGDSARRHVVTHFNRAHCGLAVAAEFDSELGPKEVPV